MIESLLAKLPEQKYISPHDFACSSELQAIDAYVCTPVTSLCTLSRELTLEQRIEANKRQALLELEMLHLAGKIPFQQIYFPHAVGPRFTENGEKWGESMYLAASAILLLGIRQEDAEHFCSAVLLSPEILKLMNDYSAAEEQRQLGYVLMTEKIVKTAKTMNLSPRDMIQISSAPLSLGCSAEIYLATIFGNKIINLER